MERLYEAVGVGINGYVNRSPRFQFFSNLLAGRSKNKAESSIGAAREDTGAAQPQHGFSFAQWIGTFSG
jgi:hypothetical protein